MRPTAEAYTFRGWAYSFAGRLDDAIEECRKAIATDPAFGNPYNDIGCYLMEQGKLDEAVSWFEQAKRAPRYEPRHFPYLNLGRLRAARGEFAEAILEFEGALAAGAGRPDRAAVPGDAEVQGELRARSSCEVPREARGNPTGPAQVVE